MNDLKIFENQEFGAIRTVMHENEIFFVATDVCKALDLSNPSVALSRLDADERSKFNLGRSSNGGGGETNVVNEYGLYNLVLASRKPSAKAFRRWITHEVLPAIRQKGTYTVNPTDLQRQRLAIMERNSKSREASLWLKIAAGSSVPAYKDVANAYAANILAGKEVLPLPEATEQTYSATDIGRMLGVSAMKIGQLANKHGLKVDQYGKLFYDKSRYSNKQVETFRYYPCAVDRFRTLLGGEA